MAVSGTGQGETTQSLAEPAFAGFSPIAESGTKAALTTGMTTDRKIFDFLPHRGIMAEIEYPGIAKLVSRLVWDQETVRSSRTTRTKIPLKSTISEEFFLFFVYCGAEFKNGPLIYFVVLLYQLYLLIRKPTDFSVVILQKTDIIFMEVFEAHSCLTHCSGERV